MRNTSTVQEKVEEQQDWPKLVAKLTDPQLLEIILHRKTYTSIQMIQYTILHFLKTHTHKIYLTSVILM